MAAQSYWGQQLMWKQKRESERGLLWVQSLLWMPLCGSAQFLCADIGGCSSVATWILLVLAIEEGLMEFGQGLSAFPLVIVICGWGDIFRCVGDGAWAGVNCLPPGYCHQWAGDILRWSGGVRELKFYSRSNYLHLSVSFFILGPGIHIGFFLWRC